MSDSLPTSLADKAAAIEKFIQKYSIYVQNKTKYCQSCCTSDGLPCQEQNTSITVLLTGTTGYLGCYVLSSLLSSSRVSKIYALNRKGAEPLRERQRVALIDRGLSPSLLQDERVELYEADLGAPNFGLPAETFAEMRQNVQVVLHLAWPVVYTWPLERFDGAIRDTCNLMCFAMTTYHSPHVRFLFGSSIVAVLGWKEGSLVEEEVPKDAAVAVVHSGYGASKYVVDRVLEKTPLNSTSLRLGQLCGSKQNGAWNPKEWVPAMLKSSITLGAMPLIPGSFLWVPSDTAARCIVEIALARRNDVYPSVFNLTTPVPIKGHHMMMTMNSTLLQRQIVLASLRFVPASIWFETLEHYASTFNGIPQNAPAAKIISAMRLMMDESNQGMLGISDNTPVALLRENGCFGPLITQNAKKWSISFRDMSSLGQEDARAWVQYWEEKGLFRNVHHGVAGVKL